MQIFQIAGYKGSGKTTLMNQLIRYFSDDGLRVGSLKHHGHGGEPDIAKRTDSYKHLESGSVISGVQGESHTQLVFNQDFELDQLIQFYRVLPLDLLLIEGYKQAHYRKIVLLRDESELALLQDLSNIAAIGVWDVRIEGNQRFPVFDMNNLDNDVSVIAEHIRRGFNG